MYKSQLSKEDQITPVHMPNSNQLSFGASIFNTPGTPQSNSFQQPQQDFYFSWCSGAHHLRWGYCHNQGKNPPDWGLCQFQPDQIYGQLAFCGV
ncbi:hypothetical protein O181_080820 [Austropuccinia psidii MF-1]|uniref:Uncharacterized protein n=1 Tax=Austropuccinia psidii MF-1 TaxID=1389203 RepID=A0A9Q3IJ95_9BASI|nr:hypothetical protein [Austropuccinia psidii MF-1]